MSSENQNMGKEGGERKELLDKKNAFRKELRDLNSKLDSIAADIATIGATPARLNVQAFLSGEVSRVTAEDIANEEMLDNQPPSPEDAYVNQQMIPEPKRVPETGVWTDVQIGGAANDDIDKVFKIRPKGENDGNEGVYSWDVPR